MKQEEQAERKSASTQKTQSPDSGNTSAASERTIELKLSDDKSQAPDTPNSLRDSQGFSSPSAAPFTGSEFGTPRPAPQRSFREINPLNTGERPSDLAGSHPLAAAGSSPDRDAENAAAVTHHRITNAALFSELLRLGLLGIVGLGDGFSGRPAQREWEIQMAGLSVSDEKSIMERMKALLNWDPHHAMGEKPASPNQRMLNRGDPEIKAMQAAAFKGDQVQLEKLYSDWKARNPTERGKALARWDPHGAMGERSATDSESAANRGDPHIIAMQDADRKGDLAALDRLYKAWKASHPLT